MGKQKATWVDVAALKDGEIWDWCREMYGSIEEGAAAFRQYAEEHLSQPTSLKDTK